MFKLLLPLDEAADGSALGLGLSNNEIRSLLSAAIRDLEPSDPDNDGDNDTYIYVYDVYIQPPVVIYENGSYIGEDGPYRMRSFAIDAATRAVTCGDPITVTRKTMWVKAAAPTTESAGDAEDATLYESGSRHSKVDESHIKSIVSHSDNISSLGNMLLSDGIGMGSGALGQGILFASAEEVQETELFESASGTLITESYDAAITESGSLATGEFQMTIIKPGFNVGGGRYYQPKAISEAATNGTFTGRKMYIDHPTEAEAKARPGRSFRDWGATITATSLNEAGHLIGTAKIVDPDLKAKMVLAKEQGLLGDFGVSIRAKGTTREGVIEGKKTTVVESLDIAKSVDIVTEPGAGGRVSALQESAVPVEEAPTTGENHVEEKIAELTALVERLVTQNGTLQTEVTEAREEAKQAVAKANVQTQVTAALAASTLPDFAKQRVAAIFADATSADNLAEAVTREETYIAEVQKLVKEAKPAPGGKVTGMGVKITENATDVMAPLSKSEEFLEAGASLFGGKDKLKELMGIVAS